VTTSVSWSDLSAVIAGLDPAIHLARTNPRVPDDAFVMLSPLICDLLWCRDWGVPELSFDLRLARIAAVGALVAALGLAGCGRKGGLDPPPGAAANGETAGAQPGAEPPPDGQPTVPGQPPPRRRTPIDFLID
jgi:predicted small lipoprotein YifL